MFKFLNKLQSFLWSKCFYDLQSKRMGRKIFTFRDLLSAKHYCSLSLEATISQGEPSGEVRQGGFDVGINGTVAYLESGL